MIDVSHVTTEFNTLFETLMSIAQKVDPVKLNLTLAATAEALDGHGLDFGRSIIAGNAVLDDINPEMPQIREDIKRLTDLATSMPNPHPISGNSSTMQRPRQAPSMSSEPISMRRCWLPRASATLALTSWGGGSPYLVRGLADLVTTTGTLNTYSPEFLCSIRNYAAILPQTVESAGGNGYSIDFRIGLTGAPNPYVYPDNLPPRSNARGGPGGAPWMLADSHQGFLARPPLPGSRHRRITGSLQPPRTRAAIAYRICVGDARSVKNTINP